MLVRVAAMSRILDANDAKCTTFRWESLILYLVHSSWINDIEETKIKHYPYQGDSIYSLMTGVGFAFILQ